ncbi:MAG: glycosyltransferase family A protein [Bacteroidales bacterium]
MEYYIITPAKNEAKFIENTLKSVIAQTIKPKKWIIVDDGSSDNTAAIVANYSKRFDFVKLIQNQSAGEQRAGGSKVVRAFNVGYQTIRDDDFDFIVKLDADLTLPNNYFEEVIKCFETNPKIGLCGGYCVLEENGNLIPESYTDDHVRGAFKAYRRECFNAMGGLKQIWSWDGIDESAIAFHGWELKVLPLAVVHHRPTSKEYNMLKFCFKTGREMYKERIEPLSLLVISTVYFFRKPVILGSLLFFIGYFVSWTKREDKVIDKDLGDYIRKYRYKKIADKFRRYINRKS